MSDNNDPLVPAPAAGAPGGASAPGPNAPDPRVGEAIAAGHASAAAAAPAPGPEKVAASNPKSEPEPGPAPDPEAGRDADPAEEAKLRQPFPYMRLLFAVLYGFLASLVFWIVILLAALQFITIAISGEKNEELDHFNRRIARYMQEMFDYMMLSSEKRPFPLGPFPAE